MIDEWMAEQIKDIPEDDILRLKVALWMACDLVVQNMGGEVKESMKYFLKLADDCNK